MLTLEDLLVANLAMRRNVLDVATLRTALATIDRAPKPIALLRQLVERHGVAPNDARMLQEAARGKARQRHEERWLTLVRASGLVPGPALDPVWAEVARGGPSLAERLAAAGLLGPPQHEAIARDVARALSDDEVRLVEQNRASGFAQCLNQPVAGVGAGMSPAGSAPHPRAPIPSPALARPGLGTSSGDARLWASTSERAIPPDPTLVDSRRLPPQTRSPFQAPAPPQEELPDGAMTMKLAPGVASGLVSDEAALQDGEKTLAFGLNNPPPDDAAKTIPPDLADADTMPRTRGLVAAAQEDDLPTIATPPRGTGAGGASGSSGRHDPKAFAGRRVAGGKFEIVHELGRGNMGIVFLARVVADGGREVALKVVQSAQNSDARARFKREILVSQRIRHPHVIEVMDAGDMENGAPFMAMEVLTGVPLGKLIKSDGPQPVARALAIFRQLLVGLEAVHEAQVVHRDLKPDNVQLLEREGKDHVKIVDFGISRFLDQKEAGEQEEGQVFVTVRGTLSGTPQYVAPEAVLDPELVSTTHDVYASGVILFELLTGTLPFAEKRSLKDILADTLNTRPRALDEANPKGAPFPPAIERFVRRLLEKDAEARPKDATAALAALTELEGDLAGGAPAAAGGAAKSEKKETITSRLLRTITGLFKRGG